MQSGRSRDNIENLSSQSDSDDNLWSHEVSFRNGRLEDSKRQDLKAEVLEDDDVFEPGTSLLDEELKKRLSLEKRLAEIEARLANIETVSTEGKADDSDVTSDSTEDNYTTSGKHYSDGCLASATRNNCEETLFPISGTSSKNVDEPPDYSEDSGSLVKECRRVTNIAFSETENPLVHSTSKTSVSQLPIDNLNKLSCSDIQSSELIDTSHTQTFDRHDDAGSDLVCERGFEHRFDHVATASDGSDWAYSVTLDSPSVLAGSETLDTSDIDTIVGDLSNKPKSEIHAFHFRENTVNNVNITEDISEKDTCESDSIEEDIPNAGDSEINSKVSGDEYDDSLDHSESISDNDGGTSSNSDKEFLQEFNEEGGVEELHNLDRNSEYDPVHEEVNAHLPHPDPAPDDNDSLDLSSHDAGSDVLKTTTDPDCLIKELERRTAYLEQLQTERDNEALKAGEVSLLDPAELEIPDNHISPPEVSNDKNECFDLHDNETEIDKEEEENSQTAETESDYPEKVGIVTSEEYLNNFGQDRLDCHYNTTETLEVTQAYEKVNISVIESSFPPVEDSSSLEKEKPEAEIHSEKLFEQTSEAALSDENCNTTGDSFNVEIIDSENIVTIESGSLEEEPELKKAEDIPNSGNPQILLADALASISADQDLTSNSKIDATLNNQITHDSATDDLDDVSNSAEDALFEVVEQICDQTYDQNFDATPVDEIPKSADEITILPVIPESDCDGENNEADLFVVHYTEHSQSAPSDQKERRSKKIIPKLNKAAVARLSKGKEEDEKKKEKKKAGTGVTLSQTFKKQKAAKNKKKSQSDLLAVDDNYLAETKEGEIDVDIFAAKKINKPIRPVGRPPEAKKKTEIALTKDAKSDVSLETSTDYLPKEKNDFKAKKQLKRASSLDKKKIKTIEYKEGRRPDFQEVKETNNGDKKECSSTVNNSDYKNRSGTQKNSDLIGESNAKAEYSKTKSTDTSNVIDKSYLKVVKIEQKTDALNNKILLEEKSDNHRRSRSAKKKPKRSRSLDRSFDKEVKSPRSRSRENPLSKQEKRSEASHKKLSVPLKFQAHYIAKYFGNNSASIGLKNDPRKNSSKKEEQENKMADTALTPVEENILQAQAKAISKMIENGTLDDVAVIPKPDAEVKEAELASVCSAAASFDSLDLLEAERAPWEIKGAGARNLTDNIVGVISRDSVAPDGATEGMLSVQDNGKKSSTEDGSLATPNHVSKIPSRTIIPKSNFKSKLPSSSARLNAPSQKPDQKSPNYSRSNSSDGDDGSAKGLAMVINGAVTPERKLSQPCDSLTSSRAPKLSSKPRSLTVDSGDFNVASSNRNSDNVSIISSAPLLPRETSASRKRMEKIHIQTMKAMEPVTDEYLTPMQRKENLLKDMKQEIKGLQKSNEEKEFEIANFMCKMNNEIDDITREKDYRITHLESSLLETQKNYEKMADAYKDSLTMIGELEKTVTDMKDEMDRREKKHQEMYLEMYNKGQETAKFERQDEIEKIGKDDPDSVTTVEVLEKLKSKELELEHWMSLKRKEMYEETELPDTEAAATLRFMKDSMFHYLTNPKEMEREVHLRAMINIFKYSTVQTRSVDKALREKKKKGKT